MNAKNIFLLCTLFSLSACAQRSVRVDHSTWLAHVSYEGARNDLMPEIRTPMVELPIREARGDVTVTTFPLTYAVACDAARTECKHAVVSTILEARYARDSAGFLTVEGRLRSEMGRELTWTGSVLSETMRVHDTVPVIGSKSEEKIIKSRLAAGETLFVDGFAGVVVKISSVAKVVPHQ